MSFTRAITVAAGDRPTSRHQRSIARATNDRLRFAVDLPWRVAWALYNTARLVRNPASDGVTFPAEGEYWKTYQHLASGSTTEWPVTGPGEPEGANLGSVIPQAIYGNTLLTDEPDRLASLFPMRVGGVAATTPDLVWQLGALQRGAVTADGSAQYAPAYEAAQTLFRFSFHDLSFHGKSFGGWQPTAPVDATHPWCDDDPGNPYGPWPNRRPSFTALSLGVSTSGLHGTITTNGDGMSVVTYAGSCPCDAPNSTTGHVLYAADYPFAWYLYVWDGTTDGDGNCVVNVDRLDKSEWVEGPYDGTPVPRHSDFPGILRTAWHYAHEFRGADSQRLGDTYQIQPIAFDAEAFWTRQYPLAPARGVVVGPDLVAVYPSVEWTADPGTGQHPLQDEAGEWAPHTGYVICGFHAVAVGLLAPVLVIIRAGTTQRILTLTPDETGAASAMIWLPDGITPASITAELSAELDLDTGGSLVVDAAELQAYRPQPWDQYLVTRMATATGTTDPQGPDYTQAADIVPSLMEHGAILGEYPASQADEITGNPLYQAWRRFSRLVRVIPRDALISYELADDVAVLKFRRTATGLGLTDADPWEGIAPPPHSIASGELVNGETYVIRGATGAVTYAGTSVAIGSEFTAGTDTEYSATGDAVPWVVDGIRHAALPAGWSNEWVFFLQTHCSNPSDTSVYKPDLYADFFTFGAPEHFRSPSIPDELYPFFNNAYAFSTPTGDPATSSLAEPIVSELLVNPEAPSAYTYAAGANSGADDLFRASRQVYPRPYEIDTCTLEFDGADQIVVLTLVAKLRQHPNAPATIDPDPAAWSVDDLASLDGTHATEPEDYRTDDNAVREYLRFTAGDSAACSFKIGDGGWDNSASADVDGNCFPNFVFVKLVPECYEDGNETWERTDTRVNAEWLQHAILVLDCICEAFVAGTTSAERVCRSEADAGLYDYTRESLYYEAFAGRSIPPIGSDVRDDNPVGFGPLPNTRIYAETHNRVAAAYNLLTRLRLDVPLKWETRTRQWSGTSEPDLTSPGGYVSGACDGAVYTAWLDDAICPTASTADYDSGWVEELSAPSVLAIYGAGLGCAPGTTDWGLNSFRQEVQWRVTIHPDWGAAIPAHIQDLVDVAGVGTVAVRTEQMFRYGREDSTPRAECDGVPQSYQWVQDVIIDTSTCVALPSGTVTASPPPPGDVAVFKPTAGSEPCPYETQHSVQYDLLAFPGAWVEVPLQDLP